jgi:hypothetical protein
MTQQENEAFAKTFIVGYPLDEALIWIRENLKPEDVFTVDQLEKWAKDNDWE